MKDYTKPRLQIIDSLSESFCDVVTDVVSDTNADRVIIEVEDLLD